MKNLIYITKNYLNLKIFVSLQNHSKTDLYRCNLNIGLLNVHRTQAMLLDDEALSTQYKSFTNNPNIDAIVCDVTDGIPYFLYYSHFSSLYIISMIK